MQGIPHIASTPHDGRSSPIPPARRAQYRDEPQLPMDEPQLPIFVDPSGWRRRTLRGMALVVGLVCLGFLLFVGMVVSGLRQPVGSQPPGTNGSAPSGTSGTSGSSGTSGADADRAGPAPAGGIRQ
ncbi:hypothetical protein [Streptomyces sp. NPDC059009]|uniref:hypothetical protein n=1 Tax=Streptomyces sp. NPDC059009 TaxID=3346694 RepID=UPI003683804A